MSGIDVTDRINGPCRAFEMRYTYGHMGESNVVAPFVVPVGMVTAVGDNPGKPWSGDRSRIMFYPTPDEGTSS